MEKPRPIVLTLANCDKRNTIKPSGTEITQMTGCRVVREGVDVGLEFKDGKPISANCLTSIKCPHKA